MNPTDKTVPERPEEQPEESGFVFHEFHENSPLPLAPYDVDRLAESRGEGRLVTQRKTNPHD